MGYGSSRREECPQSFVTMPAELMLASLEEQAEDLQRRVDAREAARTKLRAQLAKLDARDDEDHATMERLDAAIECHKRECQPRQGG
jgi:chaperonin cofactor prefoldin